MPVYKHRFKGRKKKTSGYNAQIIHNLRPDKSEPLALRSGHLAIELKSPNYLLGGPRPNS